MNSDRDQHLIDLIVAPMNATPEKPKRLSRRKAKKAIALSNKRAATLEDKFYLGGLI